MQLKTLIIAASLGLASAGTWGDEGSIATTPAAPVETPEKPVKGGEKPPVDDGDKPAPPAATTPAKGGDKPPAGGDKPGKPPGGKPTTPVAPTSSITVSYWGDEPVLETSKTTTTTDAEHTWEDVPSEETTTTSSAYYWGDESVIDTTTTTDPAHTWEDVPSEETTTTTSSEHYWGDVTTQPPAATTPVSGGHGKPPVGPGGGKDQPEKPVSGGNGKPDAPVGGGNGKPAPPAGGKCGVVTETVVNTITVTITPGAPKPPPKTPVYEEPKTPEAPAVPTAVHTWGDASVPTQAPVSGGYMGIVQEWRSKMGLSELAHDSKLESNAQDAANSSGGQLKHKLNPGSMAQVLAPGDSDNFEHVFVGGWLCELPGTAGLDGVCGQMSKGWNYAGQTGHAKILTDKKYSKIGCGLGDGIWCCDLA